MCLYWLNVQTAKKKNSKKTQNIYSFKGKLHFSLAQIYSGQKFKCEKYTVSNFLHTLDKFSELPKTLDNWYIFHFFIYGELPNSREKHRDWEIPLRSQNCLISVRSLLRSHFESIKQQRHHLFFNRIFITDQGLGTNRNNINPSTHPPIFPRYKIITKGINEL